MTFKENMVSDVKNVLLNTNELAEAITYTPKGGAGKSINAVVIRSQADAGSQGQARIAHNQAEIFIANDATAGVSSVDKGDDEASFPELKGGSPVSWAVISIIEKTDGLWHLLVSR